MLIQWNNNRSVSSFTELCSATKTLLSNYPPETKRTTVFGATKNPFSLPLQESNFQNLTEHALLLAENGWIVLDLVSFQPIIDTLVAARRPNGHPTFIMNELILPLIHEQLFHTLHFVDGYRSSIDAYLAFTEATALSIPIVHLPRIK